MNVNNPSHRDKNSIENTPSLESVVPPGSNGLYPIKYRIRRTTRRVELRTVRAEETVFELEHTSFRSEDD